MILLVNILYPYYCIQIFILQSRFLNILYSFQYHYQIVHLVRLMSLIVIAQFKKSALLLITDVSTEDIDLLIWRTGVRKRNLKTICLHHQRIYLEKYSKLNPYCCDPFNKHNVNNQNCKGGFLINLACEYVVQVNLPKRHLRVAATLREAASSHSTD